MHDTAYRIGAEFLKLYGEARAWVLDLGAYDVNGSLRDFAQPDWTYVGVDMSEGPGVDVVVEPGAPLPFSDGQFDIVLCSSVLEHDPAYWETFAEMVRVCRPGGFVYLNVPSNGPIHRYPADYWRFYPDAGLALSAWQRRRGTPVVLVESFIAERENDVWNDFVAVFAKGRGRLGQKAYLHQLLGCREVVREGVPPQFASVSQHPDQILIERLKTNAARKPFQPRSRIRRDLARSGVTRPR